jgi:acyl-CoA dehydrogenase
MSDIAMVEETTRRTIADALTANIIEAAEHGTWAGSVWDRLEAQGLTQPSAIAGDPAEALEIEAAVLRGSAAAALPLPVAETALAGWILAQHKIEAPSGPLTIANFGEGDQLSNDGGRVSGRLERVAWCRSAVGVVAIAGGTLMLLDPKSTKSAKITQAVNMAAEPRDTIAFDAAKPTAIGGTVDREMLLARCAAARAVQLAQAAARVLEITVEYAGQRKQFGKPIGGFQAIQHQLAAAASETASARVAAQQAYIALGGGQNVLFACAIAKARTNDAAGIVARTAHQVHGAIGFTQEYQLHRFTRRIQSWRGEFGASAYWNRRIGEIVLADKRGSLWSVISA